MNSAVDILILSNGPGELATWVKPVVRTLRQHLGNDRDQVRISVILSPCANASGREATIARCFPEVDRVQEAADFFPFLLWGKTAENWDWRQKGVVLFLGGDQFFPVIIGKRLGYRTVVYAEWEARWHNWIDRFGVMNEQVTIRAGRKVAHKFTVVGDLMAEAGAEDTGTGVKDAGSEAAFFLTTNQPGTMADPAPQFPSPLIGILPGSKAMKLKLGVPLTLAIAEKIHQARPDLHFVMLVAPTLDLPALAAYGDPLHNPNIQQFGWAAASLSEAPSEESGLPFLKTGAGLRVNLWTRFPAYDLLSRCSLCLTTVGANTAELGALGVPMIVLLPTQQMDVMRAWDGLPGLLANLPGVGSLFAKGINWLVLRQGKLLAWPNIWAKEEIVPELVGRLDPEQVAGIALDYLNHPDKLRQIQTNLRRVRGQAGAAEKLVQIVCQELGWDRPSGDEQ